MSNWFLFAIAAMLLFSISNTLLKVASDGFNLAKTFTAFLPAILVGLTAFLVVALYLVYSQQVAVENNLVLLVAGVLVFSLLGVVAFLISLQQGKVAEVTAILSLSTIIVAVFSTHFLAVQFSLKEIAAMVMAVASIAVFVL